MSVPADRADRWHWPHLFLLAALPLRWSLATAADRAGTWLVPGWLVLNFALLGLAERRRPLRIDWHPGAPHLRRDGSVLALNGLVDAALTAALGLLAMRGTAGSSALPLMLQVVLGIALAEFGSYWIHRWSHAGGWLWRVHLLHHRPERLNVANALTAHPVNALYDRLVRVLPLLALGLATDAVALVTLFTLTQSLVTHANVAGTIGPLSYILGSAELHRLHHSTREDQAGNFGTTIPLWDQVFGTFRLGPSPAAVGVFAPALYPHELELRRLLLWPLGREKRGGGPCSPQNARRDPPCSPTTFDGKY